MAETGLDRLVTDNAHLYEGLPMAGDALVFGRGSEPKPGGGRRATEAATMRVAAIGAYLLSHEDELGSARAEFKALFSCGWAAGAGEEKPPLEDREGYLMMGLAREFGLVERFRGYVFFDYQVESSSTIGDAVHAAQTGWFGRSPRSRYSAARPLADVAQADHMGRCVDATHWAFRLPRAAILEVTAPGEDGNTGDTSEGFMQILTRAGTIGARRSHKKLLERDALMIRAKLDMERLRDRRQRPSAGSGGAQGM